MIRCAVFGSILALAACTKIGNGNETQPGAVHTGPVTPGPGVKAPPITVVTPQTVPPAAPTAAKVELTAVTLADDCGGAAPSSAPPVRSNKAKAKSPKNAKADMAGDMDHGARERRRCEQTSMQLSVTATATTGAAARVQIKHVELFDDTGASVSVLTASSPTRWTEDQGMYAPWDQAVAPGQDLSVSYVLTQPGWADVSDRWNRTYTLRVVVTVDGGDQTVEHQADISAVTSLPPNVKT